MPSINILRNSSIERTARVVQLEGLFDVPPSKESSVKWTVELPIESIDWNVGLIVGPSGSGKSTIANELFCDRVVKNFEWHSKRSIVDCFPAYLSIKDITSILSSVGFSSPPLWVRPFHVLSNGEQFRVTLARAIAEHPDLIVIDEFTSVVDRTVAQIGSAAVAKAVRRRNQKFIAVSCHYDIAEWLEPDWIYEPHLGRFARGYLQRPKLKIQIKRVHRNAWQLFSPYHYLSTDLNHASQCYCAFWENQPVAFTAVLSFPHAKRPGWREHRTVCIPDFQGIGIGNQLSDFIASCYKAKGKPYFSTTSNPAMIRYRLKSQSWTVKRLPSLKSKTATTTRSNYQKTTAINRLTSGFEFIGLPNIEAAKGFNLI